MERHRKLISLPDCSNSAIVFRKNFHAGNAEFNLRRSDKAHRHIFDSGKGSRGMETAQLPAVSVASYGNTHRTEVDCRIVKKLLGKQDGSGTGRHDRQTGFDFFADSVKHIQFPEQFSLNGTLSSGQNQSIKIQSEITFLPQLKRRNTQSVEYRFMLREIAL